MYLNKARGKIDRSGTKKTFHEPLRVNFSAKLVYATKQLTVFSDNPKQSQVYDSSFQVYVCQHRLKVACIQCAPTTSFTPAALVHIMHSM